MTNPMRNVTPGGSGGGGGAATLALIVSFTGILLLTQALFIVPAGQVSVVTTLGKVSGGARRPGLNFKVPFVQSTYPFNVQTQVRPEEFESLTKDLQVIAATATVKYALKPSEAGRVFRTISYNDREIYNRIIKPSLLKALKSVFSKYELVTIASSWSDISTIVEKTVAEEISQFDYVDIQGLDLTGLEIAEEYRAAIEEKQIAEQKLLRAQTEVKIAEQEAKRYDTLNRSLDDQVLYKLFLDKWDGQTQVVPSLPGTNGSGTPVIVGGRRN